MRSKARTGAVPLLLALAIVALAYFLWNRRPCELTLQYVGLPPYNNPALVRVEFDDGGGRREASGPALAANRPAARFAIRAHGRLTIRVTLGAPDTLAALELPLELRPDLLLDVTVFAGDADSMIVLNETWGVAGQRAVPIGSRSRSAGRDSMWIRWGTNSLSHPVLSTRSGEFRVNGVERVAQHTTIGAPKR